MHLTILVLHLLAVVGLAQTHQPGKGIIQSRGTKITPLFELLYLSMGAPSAPEDLPVVGRWYMLSYRKVGKETSSGKPPDQWGLIVGRVKQTSHGFLYSQSTLDFVARRYTARLVRDGSPEGGARWVWGSVPWKPPKPGVNVETDFLGATKAKRAKRKRLENASEAWVRKADARVPQLQEKQPTEGRYTSEHGYMEFLREVLSNDDTITAPPPVPRPAQSSRPPVPQPSQSQRPRKKFGGPFKNQPQPTGGDDDATTTATPTQPPKKVAWGPKNKHYPPPPPQPTGGDDDDPVGGSEGRGASGDDPVDGSEGHGASGDD
ncbi:hypothetical protein LZ31DRAFT_578997 [Colletotrichum somersetense]|nr:hypothetical protein LZ31DRAFT_578997 [Colletotrichum somersetense]